MQTTLTTEEIKQLLQQPDSWLTKMFNAWRLHDEIYEAEKKFVAFIEAYFNAIADLNREYQLMRFSKVNADSWFQIGEMGDQEKADKFKQPESKVQAFDGFSPLVVAQLQANMNQLLTANIAQMTQPQLTKHVQAITNNMANQMVQYLGPQVKLPSGAMVNVPPIVQYTPPSLTKVLQDNTTLRQHFLSSTSNRAVVTDLYEKTFINDGLDRCMTRQIFAENPHVNPDINDHTDLLRRILGARSRVHAQHVDLETVLKQALNREGELFYTNSMTMQPSHKLTLFAPNKEISEETIKAMLSSYHNTVAR